jgi:fructokinase
VNPDRPAFHNLYLQDGPSSGSIVCLGEVLWDLFEDGRRLGGAPLNFGAQAHRLGHAVVLISALGADELGAQAAKAISALDLDTRLLQTTSRYPTGTAHVRLRPDGGTEFAIARPAAYDAVEISAGDLDLLQKIAPSWFYYGTLFASTAGGKQALDQLLAALPGTMKFYDVNLRPGSDSPELVRELLEHADVVKLNESELARIHSFTGLPLKVESFCRAAVERYGWNAVGVTRGERGCAILANGQYVESAGHPVDVIDTVGAGDAFAAAFLHGLSQSWPAAEIAAFANRIGAWVAGCPGPIPGLPAHGEMEEAVRLA